MNRTIQTIASVSALIVATAIGAQPGIGGERGADFTAVPGVVIDHSPKSSGIYLGSPGLAVLSDGTYIAKGDEFGPGSPKNEKGGTRIYRSEDRGKSWKQTNRISGAFWASLFVHRNVLYLMGTKKAYGDTVIWKSNDGGRSWLEPTDTEHGVLLDDARYHCAPTPVVVHEGRIWRAMEDAMGRPNRWGAHFRAFMMSAPVGTDLLKASSWTCSNRMARNPQWLDGLFGGWLEGNAVVTPEGEIVNILRVDYPSKRGYPVKEEKAAIIKISDDGRTVTFDPETGFITFPGGCKKFTIRFDDKSGAYWTLSNAVLPQHRNGNRERIRNAVALMRSNDLRTWKIRSILLYHPDTQRHGFQYLDWLFEGNDLIAVSRTAYDDGLGGAHNQHDANFLTFHRFENFRDLAMAESMVEHGAPSGAGTACKRQLTTADARGESIGD